MSARKLSNDHSLDMYRLGWISALQSVALAFGLEPIIGLRIAERGIELSQSAWKVQSPWKGYNKPKLTRHAELKSVTFSRGFDAYDYEGDDGGSEG